MNMVVTGEQAAVEPLILALDVGTSSVRAVIYDARARLVEPFVVRRPYQPETTHDGGVFVDPDQLVDLVVAAIDEILRSLNRPIAAVACDTFWHSLLGVDAQGAPLTPILTWADTRSTDAARDLRSMLDERAVHARTGAVLYSSYFPAKLLWLSRDQPDVFRRVAYWISFGEYLYLRLFGERRVSISMASGTGIFDQNRCAWDPELLEVLPVREEQLSPIADFDAVMRGLCQPYGARWPALAQVPWYLALGDGAASNVGSGGTSPRWLVAMIGTSGALRVVRADTRVEVPPGLWTYRVDRRRFVQGGALSDGGNVYAWLDRTLRLGSHEAVERAVADIPPDSHGLTVLPFLAGERSPEWNSAARAAFVGIGLDTDAVGIVRASLEAVAYRFGIIDDILRGAIPDTKGIIATGAGLLKSPAWMHIMSDVLGQTLIASTVEEASSRGAALLVLEALGEIPDITAVPVPLGAHYDPNPDHTAIYRAAMKRQQDLYTMLIPPRDSAIDMGHTNAFGTGREDDHDHSH
jgi:gluconokinase